METGEIPGLRDVYRDVFRIGAAVNPETIKSHGDVLARHFGSVTPENEMKWATVHPEPGRYAFGPADAVVAFAAAHGLAVRGHTLVWHQAVPAWVFQDAEGRPLGASALERRLEEHVGEVVGRYRGRVYAWDVVNEAVRDGAEEGDDLRASPWREGLGDGYLALAFRLAHAGDPDALLFYNDYNEWQPAKRARIGRLVARLLDAGVPLHGIGLQSHGNLEHPTPEEVDETLGYFEQFGLALQITELDLSLFVDRSEQTLDADERERRLARQAERYGQLFSVYRRHRATIQAVTFWGVADDRTWLHNFPVRGRRDAPLLFDEGHAPKPAFFAVVAAARGE